ncbi:dehydrogenase with different specificitie [Clohesyomyces aquaticus]|uniref:Dehydrogenase with different specificitie n=1 Tax=Clohesyomyces aquaticus TaxID=1231657 RepID=A0A1Y1YM92_9PLEO|nr:dehydrogenase with different specificitie [Clohesyomyces aquaticus]
MSTTQEPASALITGCSAGGIGSAIALALTSRGHRVFATMRNKSKVSPKLSSLPNVTVLELDVTSSTSIANAVSQVAHATEGKGLDVLVNNAGVGYTMPLLDTDLDEARRVFEANLWGLLAVTKAFMDLLVQAGGLVVNISSIGGEVHTPWIGIYSASKAAVTMLSETLRVEVAPLGVKVQTVQVGLITTPFWENEPTFFLPPTSRYHAIKDTIANWASGEALPKISISPDAVAKLLVRDIESRRAGRLYRGPNTGLIWFVTRFFPAWLFDFLLRKGQGVNELTKMLKTPKGE